jgi:hypothetical protein
VETDCTDLNARMQNYKDSGNHAPPKEIGKTPINDPKEKDIYEMANKEVKIVLLRKFNKP